MLCDVSGDQNAVQRQRKLKASRPRGHLLFNNDVVSTASKEAPFGPQRRIPPLQNQVVVQYGYQCVHQNPPESTPIGCHRQRHHAARSRSPSSDQRWSTSLFSPSEGQREVFGLLLDLDGQRHPTCLDRTDEQGARCHDEEEAQVVGEWWWPS